MPMGPGKYDDITTEVRERLGSTGVLVIVLDGVKGPGFSAQLSAEMLTKVPDILRDVADQIEESVKGV